MKARSAPAEKVAANARATKASASEQIERSVASGINATTDPIRLLPSATRSPRGTNVWVTAVKSAPRTMKSEMSKYSATACSTISASAPPRRSSPRAAVSAGPGPASGRASGIRVAASSPTVTATLRLMAMRRPTMVQSPWKATAVEANTTGFTTGAARMKAVAA